jgi:hypothetical protein
VLLLNEAVKANRLTDTISARDMAVFLKQIRGFSFKAGETTYQELLSHMLIKGATG